ncbi:MAG: hypothetical protein ACRDJU_06210 [Actinomycetota bacterium]
MPDKLIPVRIGDVDVFVETTPIPVPAGTEPPSIHGYNLFG